MRKIDKATIDRVRKHALSKPEDSYAQIAAIFGLSIITVKRYCSDLGRGKGPRTGRTKPQSSRENFWSRVEVEKDAGRCWRWVGSTNSSGYGFTYIGGRNVAVHRLAYELLRSPIPEGMDIDHLCKNRMCCNPDHLEAVPHRENMVRAGILPLSRMVPQKNAQVHLKTIDTFTNNWWDGVNGDVGVRCHVKEQSIQEVHTETDTFADSVSTVSGRDKIHNSGTYGHRAVQDARPMRADPFASIRTMQAPPELQLPLFVRSEAQSGTKADLGIKCWTETEYGQYWWNQTDEQLAALPIRAQTETMRENGEFLHWYKVTPSRADHIHTYVSARTGPEACVQIERERGKDWVY